MTAAKDALFDLAISSDCVNDAASGEAASGCRGAGGCEVDRLSASNAAASAATSGEPRPDTASCTDTIYKQRQGTEHTSR